jgi:hypothetical protein
MTTRRAHAPPASPYAIGSTVYSRRYAYNAKVHSHYPQGLNQPERFMLDRGNHLPSVSRFVIIEMADLSVAKP